MWGGENTILEKHNRKKICNRFLYKYILSWVYFTYDNAMLLNHLTYRSFCSPHPVKYYMFTLYWQVYVVHLVLSSMVCLPCTVKYGMFTLYCKVYVVHLELSGIWYSARTVKYLMFSSYCQVLDIHIVLTSIWCLSCSVKYQIFI